MGYLTAPTTQELQAKIIELADEETLILTPGRRLARCLRHAFRMAQSYRNRQAWLPPKIATLNTWLTERWHESWPEESLASEINRLCLWKEAVQKMSLLEGLEADLSLYYILDETYTAMVRHKLPLLPNHYLSPLISWRQMIMEIFEDQLSTKRLVHPAFLPMLIMDKLKAGVYSLPKSILCVGFESPAPVENDLLALLARDHGAVVCATKLNKPPLVKALGLPDLGQEVMWLAQDALEKAQDTPLHRIGVVVPNMSTYAPLIAGAFRELVGSPTVGEAGNYNISLGESLLSHSLIQAALLPLRVMIEGEKRNLLLALLLSPFYGLWSPNRGALAQADVIWRKNSINQGLNDLLSVLKKEWPQVLPIIHPSGHNLIHLLKGLQTKRTGAKWVETLYSLWNVLDFPAIINEHEGKIFDDLKENLRVLARDLEREEIDAYTFYAWLKYALDKCLVSVPGHQETGIQVIGLIESRGLSFDHLYAVGLSAGCLPQPVRHFPFLTEEEKKLVQGATVESQYLFADQAFKHLMTVAPAITLTRPLEEKGDPLSPSPFWPENEQRPALNYWVEPRPAWLRARWLCQAHEGWRHYPLSYPKEDKPVMPTPLPDSLSVTALETAITCPFKLFADTMLGLKPLDEPTTGIPPTERGSRLHRFFALFTNQMRHQGVSPGDEQKSRAILNQCLDQILAGVLDNPYWQIEKERWQGLLGIWLQLEKAREGEGWRWFSEEANFADLQISSWPFMVHGRIDRIDINTQERKICCWDYKTGSIPPAADIHTNFLAPQLPLYLLALRRDKISLPVSFRGLAAGYIAVKSEGEVQLRQPIKDEASLDTCLLAWEKEVADLGKKLAAGNFSADPKPTPIDTRNGACLYCPYITLCTYWKKKRENSHV